MKLRLRTFRQTCSLSTTVALGAFSALLTMSGSSRAVSHGDVDEANRFPYVVGIQPEEGGYSCSGILITPGVVLTARHCVTGDMNKCLPLAQGVPIDKSNDNFNIYIYPNAFGDPEFYRHTYHVNVSGTVADYPIAVLSHDPIDSCSKSDSSADLAIIRLDKRVPLSLVRPMHVPLKGYPTCNSRVDAEGGFVATLVGYGDTVPPASLSATGDNDGFRTFKTSWGWVRESTEPDPSTLCPTCTSDLPGAIYDNYVEMAMYPLLYDGCLKGDSGGALLTDNGWSDLAPGPGFLGNPEGRLLCGVVSRFYPAAPLDHWNGNFEVGSEMAAVDSIIARNFLAQHVLASDGTFIGECFAGDNEYLQDVDSDDDLIPDACDPCPNHYDADYDLSTTPDYDGDGVPDRCDNCPNKPNPIMVINNVRSQPDRDHDGYGDACDTCGHTDKVVVPAGQYATDYQCCSTDADCGVMPSCKMFNGEGDPLPELQRCFPGDSRGTILTSLPTGVNVIPCANHCAAPVDFDCDNVGDHCDNCPSKSNHNQADTDADGVGNACDNCPGSDAEPNQPADWNDECEYLGTGDAYCKTLDPKSVCLPGYSNATGPNGHARCSLVADADQDGIGDRCDNCPGVYNPSVQKNCNIDVEKSQGFAYPYVGDACDPNPCSDMTHFYISAYQQGWGAIEKLIYRPEFLPVGRPVSPAYNYSFAYLHMEKFGYPKGTAGMRFCNCTSTNVEDCVVNCPLSAYHYYLPPGTTSWKVLSLNEGLQSPTSFQPNAEYGGLKLINPVPNDVEPGFAPSDDFGTFQTLWYVGHDSAQFSTGEGFLRGILWSHVASVSNLLPTEQDAAAVFRPYSNNYQGGTFGKVPENTIPMPPLEPFHTIPIVVTKPSVPQWDWLMSFADVPNLVIDQAGQSVQAIGATDAVELTGILTPAAIAAFYDAEARWIAPAEVDEWPGSHPAQMVSMSRNGLAPRAVIADVGGVMTDVLQSPTHGLMRLAGETSEQPSPADGRVDYGTVLSRREGALFIVGGVIGTDQSRLGDILRYDLTDRTWISLPVVGAGVGPVLAATYRAQDQSLYAIDEVCTGAAKFARLLRIDLSTRVSKPLGAWPRTQKDRVFLTNSARGTLLLVGTAKKMYKGVELELAGDSARVVFGFHGQGRVAADPHLTDHGLTVPLEDPVLGVRNSFVPVDKLDRHTVVDAKECF